MQGAIALPLPTTSHPPPFIPIAGYQGFGGGPDPYNRGGSFVFGADFQQPETRQRLSLFKAYDELKYKFYHIYRHSQDLNIHLHLVIDLDALQIYPPVIVEFLLDILYLWRHSGKMTWTGVTEESVKVAALFQNNPSTQPDYLISMTSMSLTVDYVSNTACQLISSRLWPVVHISDTRLTITSLISSLVDQVDAARTVLEKQGITIESKNLQESTIVIQTSSLRDINLVAIKRKLTAEFGTLVEITINIQNNQVLLVLPFSKRRVVAAFLRAAQAASYSQMIFGKELNMSLEELADNIQTYFQKVPFHQDDGYIADDEWEE